MTTFESGCGGTQLLQATSTTGYYRPGVGAGDDLLVRVVSDPDGRWYPRLVKGWYYKGAQERYLFAARQVEAITYSTTGELASYSLPMSATSIPDASPTDYGPVFIESDDGRAWTRVCRAIAAHQQVSWTLVDEASSRWQCTVDGEIISIHSPYLQDLRSVTSSSLVNTRELYHFDWRTRTATIAWPATADHPSGHVYVSHTLAPTGTDGLPQQELYTVDVSGRIRVAYKNVAVDDAAALPVVTRIKSVPDISESPLVSWQATASDVGTGSSSNVITLPSTDFSPGDTVAALYYVDSSYCVTSGAVHLYSTTSGAASAMYEGSAEAYQDVTGLDESDPSYLQLNPVFSGVGNGFLYLAESQEPSALAHYLHLAAAPSRTRVTSAYGQPIRVLARLVDKLGNPVANMALSASTAGMSGYLESTYPTGGVTDWRGSVVYTWRPSATCSPVFSVGVSGMTASALTKTASAQAVRWAGDEWSISNGGYYKFDLPRLYVYADIENMSEEGVMDVWIYATRPFGAPGVRLSGIKVALEADRGSFDGQPAGKSYHYVTLDENGIARAVYKYSGLDTIRAFYFDTLLGAGRVYSNDYRITRG